MEAIPRITNDFTNDCVWLSGGALGIGRCTVEEFVRRGARVVFADIDQEGGEALQKKLNQDRDCVRFVKVDFRDQTAWDQVEAAVTEKNWQPTIFISNVGIGQSDPITEIKREDYDRLMQCNLGSAVFGAKKAVSLFPEGRGSIVFVGSVMTHAIFPNSSLYTTTKAALGGLTRTLAVELAPGGTRVNLVSPGLTKVDPCDHFREHVPRGLWDAFEERFGEQIESAFSKLQPLPRCITGGDIARAICFLCSDEARCITGIDLLVDGAISLACSTKVDQVEAFLKWDQDMEEWLKKNL